MKIHFIGIGGIGISALAQYYLSKGSNISGSDLVSCGTTESLKKAGVRIFIGKHKKSNLPEDADLVIFSPAVRKDNPELLTAKALKIKCQSYPEALGVLVKTHFTIAVSGMHGKSTVTAMIGLLLEKAGLDPTVVAGTKIREFPPAGGPPAGGSNFRPGKSKYLIIEADEHMASFLNYWPKIIVLTNIEKEHLDYYKNLKNILKTFKEYISHLGKDGILIANKDDKNVASLAKTAKCKIIYFSLKQKEAEILKGIMKVPGKHNISNALAALALGRILGIPDNVSFQSLSDFRGTWRRFEMKEAKIKGKKIILISDFAHHPTEIKSTFEGTREKFPNKKIWCVYQPHQYQRTHYLFKDFVKTFRKAPIDKIIITDIYDVAGRENKKIKQITNSKKLVRAIKKSSVSYIEKEGIADFLKKNLKGGEIVIIMGAGDVYKIYEKLAS